MIMWFILLVSIGLASSIYINRKLAELHDPSGGAVHADGQEGIACYPIPAA